MAEADHTASGKRESHAERVLAALRVFPRSTAAELARHLATDLDVVEVRRRLYDLHRGAPRRARATGVRRCTVANRQVQTWEAC